MRDRIEALRACPLLSDLPEERIRTALLPLGRERQLSKNEQIIGEREQVDWFGIVLEGQIQVIQRFASGASSLMEKLLPSYAVGVDLIFTKTRRSAYCAVAAEPSCIMVFPRQALTDPEILPEGERLLVWHQLLLMLSQANMRKHNRLAMLAQRGLRDRILTYLVLQSVRRQEDAFQISFSRDELANYLCVNRSALSHELSLMEQEGLIQFHKNRFVLLAKGKGEGGWEQAEGRNCDEERISALEAAAVRW